MAIKQVEVDLPEAYLKFAAEGYSSPTPWFFVAATGYCEHVRRFFRPEDVRVERREVAERGVPPDLVPVAETITGDIILLASARPDRGALFLLEHDADLLDAEGVFMRSELLAVAPDFGTFLASSCSEETYRGRLIGPSPPDPMLGRCYGPHRVLQRIHGPGIPRYSLSTGYVLEVFESRFAATEGELEAWMAAVHATPNATRLRWGRLENVFYEDGAAVVIWAEDSDPLSWRAYTDSLLLDLVLAIAALHRQGLAHGSIRPNLIVGRNALIGFLPPRGAPPSREDDVRALARVIADTIRARGREHEATWAALRALASRPSVRASDVAVTLADALHPEDWHRGRACEICASVTLERHVAMTVSFRDANGRRGGRVDDFLETLCPACGATEKHDKE